MGVLSFVGTLCRKGLELIAVELSGGQFLPPVQTLVATFISAPLGQKCTQYLPAWRRVNSNA